MSPGRSKLPVIIVLLIIVGALVALVVPMPRTVATTYTLVAHARVEVPAPREGVFVEVAAAGVVTKGTVLAKYDLAPLEAKKAELEKQIASLTKQLQAPPNPNAATNLVKAEAALKSATAALAKAKGKKKVAAQKKVKVAEVALAKAKAELPKPAFELEKPLQEANMVLESVNSQLAEPNVVAPVSGVFTPAAEVGKVVPTGTSVGSIEDSSKLKAVVKVPEGETLKRGQVVTLMLPKGKKRVSFDADAKGGVAEAGFDNAKGELKAGVTGNAEVEGTPAPLVKLK
ncbi:MAG: HlyD family efflux transporter periplasmic adaptor subunit [Archangium sp.]